MERQHESEILFRKDITGAVRMANGAVGVDDAERAYKEFLANSGRTRGSYQASSSNAYRYLGIMAAIILAIVGVKYIPNIKSNPAAKIYTTANAQRANITLEDGTRVVLAPATQITVTGRNVALQGEAVFTVNQHAGNPFTVKSGNIVTRVLGTKFGIRAYGNNVTVAVQDGKISINDKILSAGDVANAAKNVVTVQHHADVNSILSWTSGQLTLTGLTLAQAIPDLNRWYDADIRVRDASLAQSQFEGSFGTGSRTDLASSLEFILGAKVEQQGRTLILSKK